MSDALPVVLIIDDSEDQSDLLRRHLEKAGASVHVAGSAEEALPVLKEVAADIVIVDLMLPGMDGWDLTRKIRKRLPAAAIVITSVLDARDYPSADDTLPKPFTGNQVRELLVRLSTRTEVST